MIEQQFRSKIQPALDFLATSILIPCNLSPNNITTLAFISGAIAGILIACGQLNAALLVLTISGLLDILDGTVARLTNNSQKIGAYIDLLSDRMVEACVILGFAIYAPQHYLAYIVFLVAVLFHFSTFVVAATLFPNMGKKSMHYDQSIVERAEAFIIFSFMLLFPSYIYYFLMPFNLLVLAAGVVRFCRVIEYTHST